MKKILLGLMVLSAMTYAEGADLSKGDTPETSVEIKTTANVIASGLVIASSDTGNAGAPNLSMNHNEINSLVLEGNETGRTATEKPDFFIRRETAGEQLGRAGYTLTVTLVHDGELKHNSDPTAKIDHTLFVSFPNSGMRDINTTMTDKTSTKTLAHTDTAIEGTVSSVINAGQNYALVGNYTNTATLTVKISKDPIVSAK